MSKQETLWRACKHWIEQQEVSCPEDIWQADRVIENAHLLIEQICDIVGYYDAEEQAPRG
jgi:hypothetical protein